jgi:hypothetical protein
VVAPVPVVAAPPPRPKPVRVEQPPLALVVGMHDLLKTAPHFRIMLKRPSS